MRFIRVAVAAYALGVLAGIGATLWWIGRSMGTAERPRVPQDVYMTELQAHAQTFDVDPYQESLLRREEW